MFTRAMGTPSPTQAQHQQFCDDAALPAQSHGQLSHTASDPHQTNFFPLLARRHTAGRGAACRSRHLQLRVSSRMAACILHQRHTLGDDGIVVQPCLRRREVIHRCRFRSCKGWHLLLFACVYRSVCVHITTTANDDGTAQHWRMRADRGVDCFNQIHHADTFEEKEELGFRVDDTSRFQSTTTREKLIRWFIPAEISSRLSALSSR